MKLTLSADELKACFSVLKACVAAADLKKEQTFAKLYTDPANKEVGVVLKAKGLSFSYIFNELKVDEDDRPFKCLFDWQRVSGIAYPDASVTFDCADASWIILTSGQMTFDVPMGNLEEFVEFRPKTIETVYRFNVATFSKHLNYHNYGSHHNPVEQLKRPTRLVGTAEGTHFYSFDKQVSACLETPIKAEGLDHEILPKPLSDVLSALPSKTADEFDFGFNKEFWRVRFRNFDIQLRNVVKQASADIRERFKKVADCPGNELIIEQSGLDKLVKSFGSLVGKGAKDENPYIVFREKDNRIVVRIETSKFKNVEYDLDAYRLQGSFNGETIVLNYRYFHELTQNLTSRSQEPFVLSWWTNGDASAPASGKVLALSCGPNKYLIGRLTRR